MQNGVGNATTGYSTADGSISGVQTVKKSSAQFKSGEVAWLLNNGVTDGTQAFYQTVNSNSYPDLSGKTVYYGYESCTATTKTYSNSPLTTTQGVHVYSNGFCKFCDAYEPATDSDGDGYYEIDNAGKLYWFATQVNNGNTTYNAKLTANITINSNVVTNGVLSSDTSSFRKWIQIGDKEYTNDYEGIFDGNGKYISGIYHPSTSRHAGFIGRTKNTSTIKNLTIKDSYFSDTAIRVAAFVGCSWGTVSNCHVEDSLISGRGAVAGIVGDNEGTVTNCSNKASIVNALSDTGGIVAANYGDVKLCYNSGTITSGSDSYDGLRVGGIVGNNTSDSNIENCYNVGTVNGDDRQTGGIVGIMQSTGAVKNCHNYGTVSGLTYVGSICGEKTAGTITNCYYLENKATDSNGTKQFGVGNATAGSTTADGSISDVQTVKKTAAQFKSGEVAYLLNGKTSTSSSVWRQTVNSNSYPTFSGSIVYYGYANCGSTATYSNTNLSTTKPAHNYDSNGFCTVCDAYEPAVKNSSGVYEINNGGKLYWFASQVNAGNKTYKAKLTANITINSNVLNSDGTLNSSSSYRAWTPIGNYNTNYAGEFDGANYTISGLYFNDTTVDYIGLFGDVRNAKIKNVGVIGSYFNGRYAVGAICGKSNTGSEITNCYNKSTVNGNNHVAGICGDNAEGTITKCYNTGVITGVANKVAGITGSNWSSSITAAIDNCYNTGTISGSHQVGGLVGCNTKSVLKNSYNYGTVSGNYYVGSVSGQQDAGTITNCYYLANTATDGNGTVQFGVGNATAGSTTADTSSQTVKKTATKFKSGEVAYYLNGETATSSSVWRQTVNSNSYPTFSGSIVYYGYANCGSTAKTYSNTNLSTTQPAHNYDNGFCQVCDAYEPAIDSDGDGYYEIDNGGKLYWFASQVNSGKTKLNAELTKDIYVNQNVLNSEGELNSGTYRAWKPIGFNTNYLGTFNGQNHTISGLYYNTSSSYIGLFGKVGTNGVVDSVGLINSYIKAGSYVGGIAGYNYGTIKNCSNASTISGSSYVGGIAGYNYGTIKNCSNASSISGSSYVGGIAGYNYGTIKNCSNASTISGSSYVGGIIGFNEGNTITNCHNTGNINGNGRSVSGIIGENKMDNATITNCSNTGNISGGRYVGGIIGISCTATITNCYNTGDVTGNGYDSVYHTGAGGIVGGNTYNTPITITNCYNTGNITSTRLASGGIIGSSNKFIITDCYNTGDISATNYAGGIAGLINTSPSKITSCYNIGNVSGKTYVGSIAGEKTSSDTITNCYYLEGTATDSNGTVQFGVGNATTGSTTADVEGQTTSKTAEQFASGEVTYLLNSEVTDGTQAWYQTIGTDKTPLFEGKTVYYGYSDCIRISYSNTPLSETPLDHIYDNGFCTGCDKYEEAKDSDGDGYVEIDNGGKLYWFSEKVNGGDTTLKAELTKDIYVNKNVLNSEGELSTGTYRQWTPIGNDTVKYSGIFDGGNQTVSGLYYNNNTSGVLYAGLFGLVSNAEIKNVGVIGSYINCFQAVGGICGKAETGTKITNCYNTSTIKGNNHVAGICGDNAQGTIRKCYNKGVVTSTSNKAGGIAGSNWGSTTSTPGTIDNCYNTGTISGSHQVGGLVGSNYNSILKNSHNYGTVNGNYYVGSICGQDTSSTVKNCYYLENKATDSNGTKQFGVGKATAGSTTADGSISGVQTVKKTAAQFKSGEVAYLLNNGVTDGTQVWYQTIGTDDYPLFTGKTVYGGYKDCLAEISYSNENPEYTERPNHNFVDGTCTICGEVLAELKAANLTLDGMIGVNLYINFSDVVFEDENSVLTINVPQGTQENGAYQLAYETVEFNVNDSDDFIEQDDELWFKFTCWISAKEMTAPIIAQLKLSDGTLSKTMTYTVKQYGDTIFDDAYGTTYDNQKELVKSLLNYGTYAQNYFNYRTDDLPNAGDYFTEEERNGLVISGDERTNIINNNALVLDRGAEDKVKYYGSSLLLEDGTVIRHYFLLTDSSIDVSTLNVTIDGVSATAEKKGSFYYVDIKDIPAYSLDKKYTVCVDSMTIEYSCLSYVASALKTYTDENGTCTNASKQNLVNLATSLYKYSNSAKSYANNK